MPELRSLVEVFEELELSRPWLVFQRGDQFWSLKSLMTTVEQDLKKGSEKRRKPLLARQYWWEDDPDGKTVIMWMTKEGPVVLAAEAGSKLVPEGPERFRMEGPPRKLPPEHQTMRLGFWRMMQRIALGIPGFAGTGTVEGGQFTGEMAGVRVGWPIRPHGMAIFETVPITGFYLFGQFWPQMLGIMGLAGMNFSKLVEKMDEEFGRTPEYDLLRNTVPMPIWGEDPFISGRL